MYPLIKDDHIYQVPFRPFFTLIKAMIIASFNFNDVTRI